MPSRTADPNVLGECKNTYIRHGATAQPTKNVADELSGWPIKTMSDGKPTRSGTTEKRSRNGGRLHGRTGGPGSRAKDGLFATYGSNERCAYPDGPAPGRSTEPSGEHDLNRWVRPPLHETKGLIGLTSVDRRSFCIAPDLPTALPRRSTIVTRSGAAADRKRVGSAVS